MHQRVDEVLFFRLHYCERLALTKEHLGVYLNTLHSSPAARSVCRRTVWLHLAGAAQYCTFTLLSTFFFFFSFHGEFKGHLLSRFACGPDVGEVCALINCKHRPSSNMWRCSFCLFCFFTSGDRYIFLADVFAGWSFGLQQHLPFLNAKLHRSPFSNIQLWIIRSLSVFQLPGCDARAHTLTLSFTPGAISSPLVHLLAYFWEDGKVTRGSSHRLRDITSPSRCHHIIRS